MNAVRVPFQGTDQLPVVNAPQLHNIIHTARNKHPGISAKNESQDIAIVRFKYKWLIHGYAPYGSGRI
jgi:hypothetical protein